MMIRRLIPLFLILVLCLTSAFAEDGSGLFDLDALDADESLDCFMAGNRIDMIYRPEGQPYFGTMSEGRVVAFVDYVSLANEGVVVLRLILATQLDDMLCAGTVTLTSGDVTVTASADPTTTEYDAIVQEEYCFWLTADLQPLAESMTENGTLTFTLNGERTVTGTVEIPAEDFAPLWESWVRLGGPEQPLERLDRH